MNASQDARLIIDGEAMGRQRGRGSQVGNVENVVIDNRLSTNEDHKEAENSRDKGKKVFGDRWVEERRIAAEIT